MPDELIPVTPTETLPANPVPVVAPGNPGKSTDLQVLEFVPMQLIRYPVYDYKTGAQFFLSKRERIVVDAYLETGNEFAATRALNALHAAHGSIRRYTPKAIKGWLQKPHVARYVGEKFQARGKVNWFDHDKWEAWGVDAMAGVSPATQVQVAIWKEYGKAKGWYKDTGSMITHQTQINFMQSDGRQ